MTYIDISRALVMGTAVWPGDAPFAIDSVLSRQQGASVNLTTLTLSAHTATHVDAPSHFADEVATMEEVALRPYWGLAQVVTVTKEAGALTAADFAHVDFSLAPRLLVHSRASHLDQMIFPTEFVYPSPELASELGRAGIILYGADAPSMDHIDSHELPGHNALLAQGIAILEGLDLSNAADGVYELSALPLKIVGGDGSPVRAVIRTVNGK